MFFCASSHAEARNVRKVKFCISPSDRGRTIQVSFHAWELTFKALINWVKNSVFSDFGLQRSLSKSCSQGPFPCVIFLFGVPWPSLILTDKPITTLTSPWPPPDTTWHYLTQPDTSWHLFYYVSAAFSSFSSVLLSMLTTAILSWSSHYHFLSPPDITWLDLTHTNPSWPFLLPFLCITCLPSPWFLLCPPDSFRLHIRPSWPELDHFLTADEMTWHNHTNSSCSWPLNVFGS